MSKIKEAFERNKVAYLFTFPYVLLFGLFIVLPVVAGIVLSFTHFNSIQPPQWVGLKNYIDLLTQDREFMQYIIPNTITFALFVGVGGYVLSFFLAWILAQISRIPRTIFAIIIYMPSLTSGVAMTVIWRALFSGDMSGYLNSFLISLGFIESPVQWLQSPQHLMTIMIIVSIWNSMGVGFLAMMAGVLNVNPELYEAGAIDGIHNRLQEIMYITIPAMKPQMLFGAVMAIVGTFNVASIGVLLSGQNPTPQYAGQLIVTHIEDFGFIRYEMGYAAAISVVLLIIVYGLSKLSSRLFAEKD